MILRNAFKWIKLPLISPGMKKRRYGETKVLTWLFAALFLLTGALPLAAQDQADQEKRPWPERVRSWSLAFRPDRPELHVHVDERGTRTPYLYITFELRNNFDDSVPLNLNFALHTEEGVYHPATSDPDAEREIIVREAKLRGFAEGMRKIKIRRLKQNGRFLNVVEMNRGFVLRKNLEDEWTHHNINQLMLKEWSWNPFPDGDGTSDKSSLSTMRTYMKAGPTDREGRPYAEPMERHPAEIKGLLLFKNVDLRSRKFTLKVGGLMDEIVRVPDLDVAPMKRFTLKPRTLSVSWTWNVPRNMKQDTMPVFHRRELHAERFGPLASKQTLHRLIKYLSLTDEELDEKQATFDGQPLTHTLRSTALDALRGLTGQNFGYDPTASVTDNREALSRWNEWWYRNKHDLLYIVDPTPESEEADEKYPEDLFHSYPEHRYITVERRVGVRGKETPQALYESFRTTWNNENWQGVMDLLIVDQRYKENLNRLLAKYGYGVELGYFRQTRETGVPNRQAIEFNFQQGTSQLTAERDGGNWFIRLPEQDDGNKEDE